MALTVVNSGIITPAVGTTPSTLDTETPGSPLLYIVEADLSPMALGDVVSLTALKNSAASLPPQALSPPAGGFTNTNALTQTAVTGVAIPAGSLVVLAATDNYGVSTETFSDSQSNTYTSVANPNATAPVSLGMGASILTTPLGATDTTKVTQSVNGYPTLAGLAFANMGPVSGRYAVASGYQAATTTPSITTSASVNAGDLVVVAMGIAQYGSTFTPPAGWTMLPPVYDTSNALVPSLNLGFKFAPGGGTVTFNPTVNAYATQTIIAAFPTGSVAAGFQPVYRGTYAQPQAQPFKLSPPIPANTSEQFQFQLNQTAGMAKAFPWKLWHL
jgi:hypothetical protein